MMNGQPPIPTTRLQAFARRLLLASCTVLLMGVMGAAAIDVDERGQVVHHAAAHGNLLAVMAQARDAQVPHAQVSKGHVHEAPELLEDAAQAMARIDPAPRMRTIRMEVTAYCPCALCCGHESRLTASGKHVSYNDGRFVAADTDLLPFGTKLLIPGYANGQPVEVIDRGGAIKGRRLDVYFDDHATALEWGRRIIEVTIAD
jgi:3D (Asp-Asp-Asp) domain-containing protein